MIPSLRLIFFLLALFDLLFCHLVRCLGHFSKTPSEVIEDDCVTIEVKVMQSIAPLCDLLAGYVNLI